MAGQSGTRQKRHRPPQLQLPSLPANQSGTRQKRHRPPQARPPQAPCPDPEPVGCAGADNRLRGARIWVAAGCRGSRSAADPVRPHACRGSPGWRCGRVSRIAGLAIGRTASPSRWGRSRKRRRRVRRRSARRSRSRATLDGSVLRFTLRRHDSRSVRRRCGGQPRLGGDVPGLPPSLNQRARCIDIQDCGAGEGGAGRQSSSAWLAAGQSWYTLTDRVARCEALSDSRRR
jgi:hypothetical protein